MTATWPQTRDAIQTAIVRASGLDATHVLWAFQDTDQGAMDYVSMHLNPSTSTGPDYVDNVYDSHAAAGHEIALTVRGTREVMLELQCYTAATVATAAVGDIAAKDDALALAEKIRAGLMLPTARGLMAAVGCVPFDLTGPINYLPTIVAAGFRGRAVLDVRCYIPAPTAVEYVGFIEHVTGKINGAGNVYA